MTRTVSVDNQESPSAAVQALEAAGRAAWGAYPPPGHSLMEGVWSEDLRWSADATIVLSETPVLAMTCPVNLTADMGILWLLGGVRKTWQMRAADLGLDTPGAPDVIFRHDAGAWLVSVRGGMGQLPPSATVAVNQERRTPALPSCPRRWTPNTAGLFVPDIEVTEGGICVSRETMDEIEAERERNERALGIVMLGGTVVFWDLIYLYEMMPPETTLERAGGMRQ